jgi:hypothetical protein
VSFTNAASKGCVAEGLVQTAADICPLLLLLLLLLQLVEAAAALVLEVCTALS